MQSFAKIPDPLSTLHFLLLDGPLRRPETHLRLGAIAERLRLGPTAAAQSYGLPRGVVLVSLSVGNEHIAPHQVQPVIKSSNLDLIRHGRPPCLYRRRSATRLARLEHRAFSKISQVLIIFTILTGET